MRHSGEQVRLQAQARDGDCAPSQVRPATVLAGKQAPLPRRPKAAERAADQLRDLIQSGNLRAGDVLPSEGHLASALRVSRPVVREALRGLSLLGLVETRQGGRCSVTDLDVSRLVQPFAFIMSLTEANVGKLHEARVTVECELVRRGAAQITEETLAALRCLVAVGFDLASDPVGFRVLDCQFHEALMELAGNPFLRTAARSFYGLGLEWRRIASETPGVIERSAAEHAGIVEALATRDPERAAGAMHVHLASVNCTTLEAMQRLAAGPGARDS